MIKRIIITLLVLAGAITLFTWFINQTSAETKPDPSGRTFSVLPVN